MPTPIDPKRLPTLKKAAKAFSDTDMAAQQQLAKIYGVSNARLTTLIKTRFPDFPPAERHEDKTHWYPGKRAVESMIAYMQKTDAASNAKAQRHSAVLGIVGAVAAAPDEDDAPAAPKALPAAELDRLASAATRTWRLKREQGHYVLADDVRQIARGLNTMLTREIMNIVNLMDPNGELPPLKRQAIIRTSRDIVLKMHDQLGAYLEEYDDGRLPGIADAGTGSRPDLRRGNTAKRRGDISGAA